MSEINGLAAVAWIAPTRYEWPAHFISTSEIRNGEPLVRLSDAEAIIAQKDAEILEQCRINGMGAEREAALLSKVERQSERIKELEADADEEAHIRDRMAQLLAETAVSLKGPEKALHRHGWQDLPEVAEKQSAALKLAMEALVTARDTFTRYSLHHEAKGDFEKAQANKAFADSLKKAIAAIDAAPTPPVSEDRWQPIETAPKDGTKFLAWRRHSTLPLIVHYNDEYSQWEDADGIFVYGLTHWMPLPEAPAMQEDKP